MNKKNGIELVEPNNNLANAYIKKAEDALRAASVLTDNPDWEISSSYYAMYFGLYAVLMKIGVKCEIHVCTMEFMEKLLNNFFSTSDIILIRTAMKARIDSQYYSNRNIKQDLYENVINNSPYFVEKCKEVILNFQEKNVLNIRSRVLLL